MKTIYFIAVLISVLLSSNRGQNLDDTNELDFTPAEVESMLFLYNRTIIKGIEVEQMAPLRMKLREGLNEARGLKDTTKTITLMLSDNEVEICLKIINNSTFEAKYAELVLGMKKKLEKLLLN